MVRVSAFVLSLSLLVAAPAGAAGLPTHVGQCVSTKISKIGTRLEDGATGRPMPGSGSAVTYENGGYGVSYETVAAIGRARVGDPIRLCLVRLPAGCPKGDERGRTYRATDGRTRESWTLPDSEHACGGA